MASFYTCNNKKYSHFLFYFVRFKKMFHFVNKKRKNRKYCYYSKFVLLLFLSISIRFRIDQMRYSDILIRIFYMSRVYKTESRRKCRLRQTYKRYFFLSNLLHTHTHTHIHLIRYKFLTGIFFVCPSFYTSYIWNDKLYRVHVF